MITTCHKFTHKAVKKHKQNKNHNKFNYTSKSIKSKKVGQTSL